MPQRTYWLDLFTPETWSEINHVNYETSGFRANRKTHATKVRRGDLFLCYLTGKSRFVGVLEALSESYWDETPIWKSDPFPVRFKTRLMLRVDEDRGLHLHDVVEQSDRARSWSGYYRGSPQRLPAADGEFILKRVREIEHESAQLPSEPPIAIEVGEDVAATDEAQASVERKERDQNRIQHRLLTLGRDLGFDLWVARKDRGRVYRGEHFGDMARDELPIRFDDTTRRTIELIDVLWLDRNRIEAAFEIESKTSIYSGLLRMADLLAMQPQHRRATVHRRA